MTAGPVSFRLTMEAAEAVAAVLHSIEGLSERLVFDAYGLDAGDTAAVLDETGTPAGWFPLIEGYEALPALPPGLPDVPDELTEALRRHETRTLAPSELAALKRRLRALYEAGPGAKENDEEVDGGASDNDDEEEEAAPGARIPIPAETFLEELAQKVEIHPLSVYWLLQEGAEKEGWRCLPEERRLATDRLTVVVLQLLGHRWPKQVETGEAVPDWADPDGIIPITEGTGEPALLERVRNRLASHLQGGDPRARERELADVLAKPLGEWLATEFFKHHLKQFRKRPIAWQVQSEPAGGAARKGRAKNASAAKRPVFSCLVYYHKLDSGTLATLRTQYVGPLRGRFETELRTLEGLKERTADQSERKLELERWIEELQTFDSRLEAAARDGFASERLLEIVAKEPLDKWTSRDGAAPPPRDREAFHLQERRYDPDLNDGVRVNIAPLQKAGVLAAEVLARRDVDKPIADRAEWRGDDRRWSREGKLPKPGWWSSSR